ncbi:lipid-A-disaccharide synthase [Hyphomicrobium sp. CS1BSMeth3]|uniref:lipid-A-disaccharide synthase n=1 Tax=Hyphomicrobium sp. CS1BSMeth3 TaxID=1892844 RepID=UPI000930F29E|nr:lipid-A-disaccharide synthase [Hyphomicrobium sp. CS1BSMeth3]
MSAPPARPLRIFLVAGEHSGDALGARLMMALTAQRPGISFSGVGGPRMTGAGLNSLFPMSDIAVIGPAAIIEHLPHLLRRIRETAQAAIEASPDVVVIIDAPEFTHRVARRIRRARPDLRIVNYVSPSVWAWRSWRAARMRAYVDEVLALLPFEPDVHARLGGPPCTYVGHPLIERRHWINALDPQGLRERLGLSVERPLLLVLPGSRRSELARLWGPFTATLEALRATGHRLDVIVPTVENVREIVEERVKHWPFPTHVIEDEADKFRAFKLASAALAASGTVTLELALAGCPMIVAYRVDRLALLFRRLVRPPHFALANLVLGERAFPELMQESCVPEELAPALAALLTDTPERARQLEALARVPEAISMGTPPAIAAAMRVLAHAER